MESGRVGKTTVAAVPQAVFLPKFFVETKTASHPLKQMKFKDYNIGMKQKSQSLFDPLEKNQQHKIIQFIHLPKSVQKETLASKKWCKKWLHWDF